MAGFNSESNQAYNQSPGVNWGNVALYTAGAALSYGVLRKSGIMAKKAWGTHGRPALDKAKAAVKSAWGAASGRAKETGAAMSDAAGVEGAGLGSVLKAGASAAVAGASGVAGASTTGRLFSNTFSGLFGTGSWRGAGANVRGMWNRGREAWEMKAGDASGEALSAFKAEKKAAWGKSIGHAQRLGRKALDWGTAGDLGRQGAGMGRRALIGGTRVIGGAAAADFLNPLSLGWND